MRPQISMRCTCPGASRDAASSGSGKPPLWGGGGDSASSLLRVQRRSYSYDFREGCREMPGRWPNLMLHDPRNVPFQSSNRPPRVIMQPVWTSAGKRGEKAAVSELKTTRVSSAHRRPGPAAPGGRPHRPGCSTAARVPPPRAGTSTPGIPKMRVNGVRQVNFRE